MQMPSSRTVIGIRTCAVLAAFALTALPTASAQTLLIPGTGTLVDEVGDHFEDENWSYVPELPKGSGSLNHVDNFPAGYSVNGRWSESTYRGQPCLVKRVPTPAGGLKDSKGALQLRSLNTGVPGRLSYQMQQDDLLCNINTKLGGYIPVSWNPNFVVRVFLPPWEQWEDRTGPSFGVRADLMGTKIDNNVRFRRFSNPESEQYWPGLFICHQRKQETADGKPLAYFIIRAGNQGEDLSGPTIKETGWWTIGMSFTGDGKVHYFASPGLDHLKREDYIGSYYPHGFRAERFQTFFFNVVNNDDGRTWSTPWVVDDCMFYMTKR